MKHDAPQSVGLLWTSDQRVAVTFTWQHTTLITNIYVPGRIRTHNLSRRAALDLRLKPRGYCDRLFGRLPEDFIGSNIPLYTIQYDKFTYYVFVSAC
jgi:hypothetical protein